jgi:dienelactone hydrolase
MPAEQSEIAPCCISGHIHEGTPEGTFQTIAGLRTYATQGGDKRYPVIFLPDVFGIDLRNTQLLADESVLPGAVNCIQHSRLPEHRWAKQGFYVLLPDVLE